MLFLTKILNHTMVKESYFIEKYFKKITKNAYDKNYSILMKIVKKNKETEFGKNHHFSDINSLEDYKRNIFLSNYGDYEKYIMRMCKGEKNILVYEDIVYFGLTSGTTGKQKLIPFTKTGRDVGKKYMSLLSRRIVYKNFKKNWTYGKGLALTDISVTKKTVGGMSISSATAGGMRSIKNMIPLIWTSPIEVMKISSKEISLYLHLIFALKEYNLMDINGVFISSVLDLFRYMENHWMDLVDDIRKGSINRKLVLDDATRSILMKKLKPDGARAFQLESEFKKGFKGIVRRIWPSLLYINCVTGANFSIYDNAVNWYTDNLPIYSGVYAATESIIGFNPFMNKIKYVILPDTAFFEFIPVEYMNEKAPITKTLNELKVGGEYEIVTTNFSGLYRYRIGDVVKVVGYYNNSPTIEFLYRKNQLLNMVSEKTTEDHALKALNNTFLQFKLNMTDYTTIADNSVSPGKYIFFLEIKEKLNETELHLLQNTLDKELCKANGSYKRHRLNGELGRLNIKVVTEGTFYNFKNILINDGTSKSQIKIPRVIMNEKHKAFMLSRLV